MRSVIQRVSSASVIVDGKIIGEIGNGLLIFLGVSQKDVDKDIDYLVNKAAGLRIFKDKNQNMNLSIRDVGVEALVVSQFTLFADTIQLAARSGGVKNAHMMSAVLSVMDVPRRWVTTQLEKKDEDERRRAEKAQDETQAQIATKIGISKGVGAVDLLAFLIAFFTAKEETLLCLLTEEQFADLEEEFPSGFFDELERRDTIAQATNDIALRAYDAYQLFRYAVMTEIATFVHPVETS